MPSPRNKRVTIAKGAGLRKFLLGDSLGSKPILKKLLVFLLDQRDIIMGVVRGAISAVEVIAPNGQSTAVAVQRAGWPPSARMER